MRAKVVERAAAPANSVASANRIDGMVFLCILVFLPYFTSSIPVAAARSLFNVAMKSVRTPGRVLLESCRLSSMVFGNKPVMAEAVTGKSVPEGAPPAPVNE